VKALFILCLGFLSFCFPDILISQTFEDGFNHYKKSNLSEVMGDIQGKQEALENAFEIFKILSSKDDKKSLIMHCLISLKLDKEFSHQFLLLEYVKEEYPDYLTIESISFYGDDKVLIQRKIKEFAEQIEVKSRMSLKKSGKNRKGGNSFKFPKRIMFNLLKNDKIVGRCQLLYNEDAKYEGLSSLKLIGFNGLGITSEECLFTYAFKNEFSIYSIFRLKGKQTVYEIGLREDIQFGGQKGKVLICKIGEKSSLLQIAFHPQYPVMDLLTLFLIGARTVFDDEKGVKTFNLLIEKSTKRVDMIYSRKKKSVFQGKEETTHFVSLNYNKEEILRLNIFKNPNGYCFPVKITISGFSGRKEEKIELIAKKFVE
jgi:hypothetical protein